MLRIYIVPVLAHVYVASHACTHTHAQTHTHLTIARGLWRLLKKQEKKKQVGSFTMAQMGQSKSVIGEFMKQKRKENGASFEGSMLKLLRTLPKVLVYEAFTLLEATRVLLYEAFTLLEGSMLKLLR
jgi:hypothetical protein